MACASVEAIAKRQIDPDKEESIESVKQLGAMGSGLARSQTVEARVQNALLPLQDGRGGSSFSDSQNPSTIKMHPEERHVIRR